MNYAWNSELIELSDVAYATQNLHKWFTALRYAIYMYMLCYVNNYSVH